MPNLSSLARPYAHAAFEYARENKQLKEWATFLTLAASVVRNPEVQRLLQIPDFTSEQLNQFFEEVLARTLDDARKNFLKLLGQYHRYNVLPEIVTGYNALVAALEKVCTARVITAVPATDDFQQRITKALANRTKSDVSIVYEVDPEIIGGAIVHIRDEVMDGSVRNKLDRLQEFLLR